MKTAHGISATALAIGLVAGAGLTQFTPNSSSTAEACHGDGRPMARLELVFGTSRSKGMPIGDEEWSSFLDAEVTPRFPAGFTVLHGPGQWRGADGLVMKEQSNVLVIWYVPTARAETDIETIRQTYKTRFKQESVMRVDSASCVSF